MNEDTGATTLEWLQPKAAKNEFHLVAAGKVVAQLTFDQWGKNKTACESRFGKWRLQTEGFWNPTYHLQDADRGIDIASYSPKWHGAEGIIQMSHGMRFIWKVTGMFSGRFAVLDEAGTEIIRTRLGLQSHKSRWSDWMRTQGTVELASGSHDKRETLACTILCWFLILLHQDHDGTVTTAMLAASS